MRIVLALLPVSRRECPSYELAMVAALARSKGHEVVVLDVNNDVFHESYRRRTLWKYTKYGQDGSLPGNRNPWRDAQLIPRVYEVLNLRPDAIIFMGGSLNYDTTHAFSGMIKEVDPSVPVVFMGFKMLGPHVALQQFSGVCDYAVFGEGEAVLLELLADIESGACRRGESKISKGIVEAKNYAAIEDLDALPFLDFRDAQWSRYGSSNLMELKASRSCAWNCRFCVEWLTERKYRSMSGRRIFEEIVHQARTHPSIQRVRFDDASINGEMAVLDEFVTLASGDERRFGVEWFGMAMIREEMTAGLLRGMGESRCIQLNYGLESGSEKVLADMEKRFTLATAERVLRDTHRFIRIVTVNVVVGFPTETRADFMETVEFIARNRSFITDINVAFPACRIEKASYLHRQREDFGITWRDEARWEVRGGDNAYPERIDRFRILCEACIEMDLPISVHGRQIRNKKNLADIMGELLPETLV